jgi:hypothetical protein
LVEDLSPVLASISLSLLATHIVPLNKRSDNFSDGRGKCEHGDSIRRTIIGESS